MLGHEIVGVVALGVRQVEHLVDRRARGRPVARRHLRTPAAIAARDARTSVRPRVFTGYDRDGGYSELAAADARYCFPIPDEYGDADAAPLLCAGLIGYRALRKAGDAVRLGLYGFGAAAHIVAQVARMGRPAGIRVHAAGRQRPRRRSRDSSEPSGRATRATPPPEPLDAAILFAPVGALVPAALRHVERGGTVVCAGIHMSDIPSFPYEWLWGERTICSVANLTRADGEALLAIAPQVPIRTEVVPFPLEAANEALEGLAARAVSGGGGACSLGGGRRAADGRVRIRQAAAGVSTTVYRSRSAGVSGTSGRPATRHFSPPRRVTK